MIKETILEEFYKLPLFRSMVQTDHNIETKDGYKINPYHMEGSVWTHTMMVANKATNDDMFLLALLHDVGKPFMYKLDTEKLKTHFMGHEIASAYMSVNFLKKHLEMPLETALKVIALHTIPFRDNVFEYIPHQDFKTANILQSLCRIDSDGRFTTVPHKETPKYPFIESNEPIKEDDHILYVTMGIPGSGKSTWLKDQGIELIVAPDDYLMKKAATKGITSYSEAFSTLSALNDNWTEVAKQDLVKHMKNKTSKVLAYDATNLTQKGQKWLFDEASKSGYKVAVRLFFRDFEDCVASRQGDKKISLSVYNRMFSSFTWPKIKYYNDFKVITP